MKLTANQLHIQIQLFTLASITFGQSVDYLQKTKELEQQLSDRLYLENPTILAPIYYQLSIAAGCVGDYQRMIQAAEKAFPMLTSLYGPGTEEVADSTIPLAIGWGMQGDLPKKQVLLELALLAYQTKVEHTHPKIVMAYSLLGIAHAELSNEAKVTESNTRAVTSALGSPGGPFQNPIEIDMENLPNNPQLTTVLTCIGISYLLSKKNDDALRYINQAIRIATNTNLIHTNLITYTQLVAANIHSSNQAYTTAEYHFNQVLAIKIAHFGVRHWEVALIKSELALLHGLQGNHDKQFNLLTEISPIIDNEFGSTYPQRYGEHLVHLGTAYVHLKEFDLAKQCYLWALNKLENKKGEDEKIAEILLLLVEVYTENDEQTAIKLALERVLRIYEKSPSANYASVIQIVIKLNHLYLSGEEFFRSKALCDQYLEAVIDKYGSAHPDTARMLYERTRYYQAINNRDLAYADITSAYSTLCRHESFGENHTLTQQYHTILRSLITSNISAEESESINNISSSSSADKNKGQLGRIRPLKTIPVRLCRKGPNHDEIKACLNLFLSGGLYDGDVNNLAVIDNQVQIFLLKMYLQTAKNQHGEKSIEVARVMVRLSIAYGQTGNYKEQFAYADDALGIGTQLVGVADADTNVLLTCHALSLMSLEEYKIALDHLLMAQVSVKNQHGEWGLKMGHHFAYIASCYAHLENHELYHLYKQEPLTVTQRAYNSLSTHLAIPVLNWAASAAIAANNMNEASERLTEAVKCQTNDGPDKINFLLTLQMLATLQIQTGYAANAQSSITQAMALQRVTLGEQHVEIANSQLILAESLRYQRKFEQELEVLQVAQPIIEANFGGNSPRTAKALTELATAHQNQLHHEKAKLLYERALNIYEKHYGTDHPAITITLGNLANTYADLHQHMLRICTLERALLIEKSYYGTKSAMYATAYINLGRAYGDLDNFPVAVEMLAKGVAILEAKLGHSHPQTATGKRFLYEVKQALKSQEIVAELAEESMTTIQHSQAVFSHRLTYLPPQNPNFVNRPQVIQQIEDQMSQADLQTSENTSKISFRYQPLLIVGPSGVGKETLAVNCAYENAEKYQFIRYLDASKYCLESSLYEFARQLKIAHDVTMSADMLCEQIHHRLQQETSWLLIMANVKAFDDIAPYLPKQSLKPNQHIIVVAEKGDCQYKVEVGRFSFPEASALIESYQDGLNIDQHYTLAKCLRQLPQAIRLAVGIISTSTRISTIKEYTSEHEKRLERLFPQLPRNLANQDKAHIVSNIEFAGSKIEDRNPEAVTLLHVMGYIASTEIPVEALSYIVTNTNLEVDLEMFRQYGLVQLGARPKHIRMTAMLQGAIKYYDTKHDVDIVVTRLSLIATGLKNYVYNCQQLNEETTEKLTQILPHLEILVEHFDKSLNDNETRTMQAFDRIEVLQCMASILKSIGCYQRFKIILERILELGNKITQETEGVRKMLEETQDRLDQTNQRLSVASETIGEVEHKVEEIQTNNTAVIVTEEQKEEVPPVAQSTRSETIPISLLFTPNERRNLQSRNLDENENNNDDAKSVSSEQGEPFCIIS